MLDLFVCVYNNNIDLLSGLGRAGDGIEWTRDGCTDARNAGLLERKQARACRVSPDVMSSLVQAAKDTSIVCQQAFRHRRWNCSSIERAPNFSHELVSGITQLCNTNLQHEIARKNLQQNVATQFCHENLLLILCNSLL